MGASLYDLATRGELPEPARTQEAVGFSKPKRRKRAEAKQDLRRMQGSEAREFRQRNPGADVHDWERFQDWKNRPGNEPGTVKDWGDLDRLWRPVEGSR